MAAVGRWFIQLPCMIFAQVKEERKKEEEEKGKEEREGGGRGRGGRHNNCVFDSIWF